MRLYDFNLAPNPRRVRIFAAEKGIALETVSVDLRGGGQFEDEFRAVNPRCTVPVLELDDGTRISESVAICRYLEEIAERLGRTRSPRATRSRALMDIDEV